VMPTPPAPVAEPTQVPLPTLRESRCSECVESRHKYEDLKQKALDRERELMNELDALEDVLQEEHLRVLQLKLPDELVEFIVDEYVWNPRKEPEEPTLYEKLASVLASYKKIKTWYARLREENEVLSIKLRQCEQHAKYLEGLLEDTSDTID